MPFGIVFIVALGVFLLESVFLAAFGIQGWTFSTPIAVAIYLGLEREFVPGGLTLAALLLPIEWLVVGVGGLYSLALVVVFFAMCGLRGQIQSGWGMARGVVALVAALIHGLVLLIGVGLVSGLGSTLVSTVGWKMWSAALIAAVVTVLLGRVFARLDRLMDPRRGKRGLEFK